MVSTVLCSVIQENDTGVAARLLLPADVKVEENFHCKKNVYCGFHLLAPQELLLMTILSVEEKYTSNYSTHWHSLSALVTWR